MLLLEPIADGQLVTRAGAYAMSMAWYHDNCCDAPSISPSGLQTIEDECPRAYWANSYWYTDRKQKPVRRLDLAKSAHMLLSTEAEFHKHVKIIEGDAYRSNAAKAARDKAIEDGLIPLLEADLPKLDGMRESLASHKLLQAYLDGALIEPSLIYKHEAGVWMKNRMDVIAPRADVIIDMKMTSAKPSTFSRRLEDNLWHIQAYQQWDAYERITGREPAKYLYLAVEETFPHIVKLMRLSADALQWGMLQGRAAIYTFAECARRDEWPDYGAQETEVGLPSWAQQKLEERRQAGEFEAKRKGSAETRAASDAFQAP